MHTLKLRNVPVESSVLGLGCMGMSEFYGARDDAQSQRTLDRAFELGITHYDTSNVYGRGHNEQLLSHFIKDKRDRIVLASKFGVRRDPNGPEGSTYDREIDNSPQYMTQCCEESLRRLETDRIDLYYIHRTDPKVPIEDTIGAMAKLIEEGKIRAIGLSEVNTEQLRRAHAVHPIAALQSEYSLWTREPERDVLPLCKQLGVVFVAYSPLGRGFLTGAIRQASELAKDDFRLTSPRFQGDNFERNRDLIGKVQEFCAAKRCTAGQVALAWLLSRDQDIIPIPGTKRIKYLEENVAATGLHLTQQDLEQLESVLPPGAAAGARYESNFGGVPKPPSA
jgi:aryl-alcohol dehydrogenase-like predicted oxidoreductase